MNGDVMPGAVPGDAVVLLSPQLGEPQRRGLAERFPDVRFVLLDPDGSLGSGGEAASALLRLAIGKPALSAALQAAPGVRWVHTSTAGFDWAMVPEIEQRGITLTRSAASYAKPIGEFTLALILSLVKRLPRLAEAQTARHWASVEPQELADLTIGVVGAGAIGHEVAWRCAALGMRVIGSRRTPVPQPHFERVVGSEALPELLAESDVVVVACPLTPETRGLIDAAAFSVMKPTAFLINVARGPIVVADDLRHALEHGVIAGAAMDAFDIEPLPEDDPLWSAPNLTITPHTSFKGAHNQDRVLAEFEENLRRFLRGEPLLHALRDFALGY